MTFISTTEGSTTGYKELHRLENEVVHGHVVRIKIKESMALPLISSIGLHFDPYWEPDWQSLELLFK
ncbi:hypothetical protein Patl1_20005 [Pistacia atlantica]|uniref:Uncharacterized protein n=1 Tax=Pistacia atlantica TaxID=434234 RepID=A0ACC1BHH4_9ROSI|nr:hypothetical protein Patl1_20005 [Pistacia atlantica]